MGNEQKPAKLRSRGPQSPTIIEKVIDIAPGPFFLKSLLFWIVFGTPGMVLTRYLDTLDINKALAIFSQLTPQDILIFSIANFTMPLYAFYGINYMRKRTLKMIPEIEPLTTDGIETLNKAFGSISRTEPAIVLGVLFAILSIVSFPGQTEHVLGYLSFVVKVVGFAFSMLAYGAFIWMFSSSIRGLHQLGEYHLRLMTFLEDSHLGMKPLGSFSLSFAWIYFLGIGLVFFSATPVPIPLILALLGLIALGLTFFFLPLRAVHERMAKEKASAEKLLRRHLAQIVKESNSDEGNLAEISQILAFQVLEQKVSKISEWPFDTVTLSWFSAIVIAVVGTIITRYLLVFLGL